MPEAKKIIVNELNYKDDIYVNVNQLLLWRNNPRLIELREQEVDYDKLHLGQEELLEHLLTSHKAKDLALDILDNGWIGKDTFMVAEYEKNDNGEMTYIVIEGNRRTSALKYILNYEKDKSSTLNGYDISDFEKKQLKNGIRCINAGPYSKLLEKGDIDAEVKRILTIRHGGGGQEEWPLHRKAYQTFNMYMEDLAIAHPNVDPYDPETFFIDNNLVKVSSRRMCESVSKIKQYLWIYTLRNQISKKLVSDYGIDLDDNKTSFIVEFLKKPALKNRYEFDPNYGLMGDENILINDMTPLELFISLIFRYDRPDGSENKPIITAAAAGQSNLRDYGYVVENDRNELEHVKMIEVGDGSGPESRQIAKIARAKWDSQSLKYKVGEAFKQVVKILGTINFDTVAEAKSDAMVQDYDKIKKIFNKIDAALKAK